MTKLRNKLVIMLLALCLVVCMGVMVACGGDDDKKSTDKSVTYTVTVKADGVGVKGVKVTVSKGGASFTPQTTDDDGKVTFKLNPDNGYTVALTNLPEHFSAPAAAALSFGENKELTVNLTEDFAYKVKLVNAADNKPFYAAGVTVGICKDGNCLEPVAIGTDGVARIYDADKTNYTIQILNLPAAYAYEHDEHKYSMHQNEYGSYYYDPDEGDLYNWLTDTVTEQTIKIYPVTVADVAKLPTLTADDYKAYDDQGLNIYAGTAYKLSVKVPAKSSVYYVVDAESDASYSFYSNDYAIYSVNNVFWLGTNGTYVDKYGTTPVELKKGNRYYLNVTNEDEAEIDAQLVIATKAADGDQLTAAGEAEVTVYSQRATAVIEFSPTFASENAGASFKATVQGDASAAVRYFSYNSTDAKGMARTLDEQAYTKNSTVSFKLTAADMQNIPVYLGVAVAAKTYPATVKVKIEKIKDFEDVYNKVEAAALSQYTKPAGNKELVPLALDNKALVKDAVGNYRIGSASGSPVVVKITSNLDKERYGDGCPLIYIDYYSAFFVNPYVVNVTTPEDMENLEKGNTFNDYRWVLRGFGEYPYNEVGAYIPTTVDYDKDYYAKYVNEDGVYPLNDQLMAILKDMAKALAAQTWGKLPNVDEEYLWKFACYSYENFVEPDQIVGDYVVIKKVQYGFASMIGDGTMTQESYKVSVGKFNTFTIDYYDEGDNRYVTEISGTWSRKDDAYTFTDTSGFEPITYSLYYPTVMNIMVGLFTLEDKENGNVWVFVSGGDKMHIVSVTEDATGKATLMLEENDDNVNTFALLIDNKFVAVGEWLVDGDDVTLTTQFAFYEYGKTDFTYAYADGVYTVKVKDDTYTFTPGASGGSDDEGPEGLTRTMFTEDWMAKLEMYDDGTVKFYVFDTNINENVLMAHCVIGGDGEEVIEIVSYIFKHDSVDKAEITVENEAINVKVTYTDKTVKTYVFEL